MDQEGHKEEVEQASQKNPVSGAVARWYSVCLACAWAWVQSQVQGQKTERKKKISESKSRSCHPQV